ncbi:MAG: sugar nucleotide-binding protein [Clostridiales bacterium]|nr:sugar nucleotide-binding protein [Clostridiales bacterium]
MKAIITGMCGTLAPYIYDEFISENWEVVVWEKHLVPTEDLDAIKTFITNEQPDAFLHIASGPVEWIENIIKAIKPFGIPLIFTSSEAVFDDSQEGPFSVDDIPRSKHNYGKYKLMCENIINRDYIENSYIIRLGWQIALHTHKNNMLAYLVTEGHIKASKKWILSASFMPDTAYAIFRLIKKYPPGLYHLDGNQENLSYYELITLLKETFMLPITIEEDNSFKRNNQLLSEEPLIHNLKESILKYKDIHHL